MIRRTGTWAFLLGAALLAACVASLRAPGPVVSGEAGLNVPLPTLGGVQLWSDLYWYPGWRIQQNLGTGHYRLLGPSDTRRAWGTYAECRAAFERVRLERRLEGPGGELVILVHGLGRSRASMASMERALREAGYATYRLTYASTRGSLEEHARRLRHLLQRLEGVDRVSFVTHSMGGIVLRELFRAEPRWSGSVPLGRIVMLAPPNRGSALARMVSDAGVYEWLLGASAEELASREIQALPAPPCPTGIIAGGDGGDGKNPLLEGDDDGIVRVAETRLEGAADFLLVDSIHTTIMNRADVQRATVRFLREGRFGG